VTDTRQNTSPIPRLLIDPDAIASRLETLDATPLCDSCRTAVLPVTADAVALLIETIRLWNALHLVRLESANRLAAMRAALHADAESEPDPLAYLRYEIPAGPGSRPEAGRCR
jgi:hypothetical protein